MSRCPFKDNLSGCSDEKCELWSNAEEECSIKSIHKSLNSLNTVMLEILGCMRRM